MRCDVLSRSVFFFFFARQHSEHHLPLICTAVIMIVRYDTMRRVLFFFFALVCHVNLKCNLVAHLVYHLAPLVSSSSVHTQEAQYEDTWTWLLVATFSRVNIPPLCLPKFFGVVAVTPLARLLKTCCLF